MFMMLGTDWGWQLEGSLGQCLTAVEAEGIT